MIFTLAPVMRNTGLWRSKPVNVMGVADAVGRLRPLFVRWRASSRYGPSQLRFPHEDPAASCGALRPRSFEPGVLFAAQCSEEVLGHGLEASPFQAANQLIFDAGGEHLINLKLLKQANGFADDLACASIAARFVTGL